MKSFLFTILLSLVSLSPGYMVNIKTLDTKQLPEPYRNLKQILPYNGFGWFYHERQIKSLIEKHHPQTVIEVGSFLGLSTRSIATYLPENGIVYAIDHWEGSAEHRPGQWAPSPVPLDQLYDSFLSNVIHTGLTHKIIPIRMESLYAAKTLSITADLIYIDASHDAESVYQDLTAWYPHLNAQGIISGDDWQFISVKQGVQRFLKEHPELKLFTDNCFFCFFRNK